MIKLSMTKVIKHKQKTRGVYESFLSIIPYSLIPLIFLINFGGGTGFGNSFIKGAVITEGKDFISTFAFIAMVVASGKVKKTAILWNKKAGLLIGISSIFGGPLGYTFYNTAFYLAGPSFGHIFTSLEPVFLSIFAVLYLKRKFKWQMWLGIFLAIAATISIVAGESFAMDDPQNIIIGALLGILGAACWTVESIAFDRSVTILGDDDIMPLLVWKMIYAMVFNFVFMFPISGLCVHDVARPFRYFSEFFTNTNYLWRFILVGVLIVFARMLFFGGLKHLGATYANIIYGLTIILIPFFNFVYYWITGDYIGGEAVRESQINFRFQIVFWSIVPVMVTGASLVTWYKPDFNRKDEIK